MTRPNHKKRKKSTKALASKCQFCSKVLSSYHHLTRHQNYSCRVLQQRQHVNNNKNCPGCFESFSNQSNLKRHMSLRCKELQNPTQSTKSTINDHTFTDSDQNENYSEAIEVDLCENISQSITENLKELDTSRVEVEVPTVDCNRVFESSQALTDITNVTNQEEYHCLKCDKFFKAKKSLNQHKCPLENNNKDEIPLYELSVPLGKDRKNFSRDLAFNTSRQISNICLIGNRTLHGHFPYFFPQKVDIPILKK